ncbi:MAG: protein-glutamate O-methyltransferase CheR [Clostridiales bacterium]|nr:protein-glutamate O-methyltransferase CheR [Clostridiales bacterium]
MNTILALGSQEFFDISEYIKKKYGVNLAAKSSLVEGRLSTYVRGKGFWTYGDYFEYAKTEPSGAEMANLINRLTTNHTFFMRENDHFEVFTKETLPWILSLPDGHDLRLWSAGCSTGEEPYGLSIYIFEYMEKHGYGIDRFETTVLASDISEKALTAASGGVFHHENLSAMPPEWVGKYFYDLGEGYFHVMPKLRANVAFKKINLLDPPIAKKPFHAVFCRNVMIYFDAETRETLVSHFYDIMEPGGWLFVGHSESLNNIRHGFKYLQPSVYMKPL